MMNPIKTKTNWETQVSKQS